MLLKRNRRGQVPGIFEEIFTRYEKNQNEEDLIKLGNILPTMTGHLNRIKLEVYELANIKSAKKRILVNRTKAARNKAIKSAVKTSMKKVEAAVAKKDA